MTLLAERGPVRLMAAKATSESGIREVHVGESPLGETLYLTGDPLSIPLNSSRLIYFIVLNVALLSSSQSLVPLLRI